MPADLIQSGYRRVVRPAVFRIGHGDPEEAHEQTLRWLARLGSVRPALKLAAAVLNRHRRPVTVAGIDFPGVVGVAGGLDKNGIAVRSWGSLGFGFAELGTVTAQPQPGNPRPRLFRLPASQAVINRMGFNNAGAEQLAATLQANGVRRGERTVGIPIGVSIGKTKITPLDQAVEDYLTSFRLLADTSDYLAVNVSSPNTPGLRSLQDKQSLGQLLAALTAESTKITETPAPVAQIPEPVAQIPEPVEGPSFDKLRTRGTTKISAPVPIFVKIAPDLTEPALDEVLEVCAETGVAGLIATNTTLARDGIDYRELDLAPEAGGLSGAPLARRARHVVGYLAQRTDLPIIGVGGINTADDAQAMLDAGASLLQVLTGFIYHGPGLINQINRATRINQEVSR